MIKTLKAVYAHDFVGSSAFSAADLKYFIANVIMVAVPLLFAHPQIVVGVIVYYVLIFVPFIWLANAIFVMGIRYFLIKKWMNYWSFGMSALLKTAFLFSIALVFVNFFKFPAIFLQAMGVL